MKLTHMPTCGSPNVRVGECVGADGPTHRRSHRAQVLLLAREQGRCCAYCEVPILPRLSLKSAFSGDQIARYIFVVKGLSGRKHTYTKYLCAILLRTATFMLASLCLFTQNYKRGH